MDALRCLIDSMIFDAIAAEPGMLERVAHRTSARRLALLAAATSIDQITATPDVWHRKRLQRVRVLVVIHDDDDPAQRALLAALAATPGVGREDALIAAAAAAHAAPLVTEDRALREAVASLIPDLPVWDWATGLRPRVLALPVG